MRIRCSATLEWNLLRVQGKHAVEKREDEGRDKNKALLTKQKKALGALLRRYDRTTGRICLPDDVEASSDSPSTRTGPSRNSSLCVPGTHAYQALRSTMCSPTTFKIDQTTGLPTARLRDTEWCLQYRPSDLQDA